MESQPMAKLWHCTVCKYSNDPSSPTLAALESSSRSCYLCSFLLDLIADYHPESVLDRKVVDPDAVVYITWKWNASMPGDLHHYPVKLGCPSLWLRLEIFDSPCKYETSHPLA